MGRFFTSARRRAIVASLAMASFFGLASTSVGDAMERLKPEKLEATHQAVEALQPLLQPVELKTGYDDYRAILHCHSGWSHDSRSTIDEVVAGAKKAGVRVLMFSEHPAPHYDYFTQGHQGMRDGVLLIPGAETKGFHAYPTRSMKGLDSGSPQEFTDVVRRFDGLVFLCHLEERMDWDIVGLTGSEIYNTHADVKEERRLFLALANPFGWGKLSAALENYPQEVFASLQDYPKGYLKRFDELCQKRHLCGVAGNDSHHNQCVSVFVAENDRVTVMDALGEKLAEFDAKALPFLKPLIAGKKVGDVALKLDLDPYPRSFHHVSTHLLMNELTVKSVWDALKASRAYVAFDWIAEPTGFAYVMESSKGKAMMGERPTWLAGMRAIAEAPLPAQFRLIRNGTLVAEAEGRRFEAPIAEPGVYRVEAWLQIADELRPWILSNPIYVRPADAPVGVGQ